MPHPLPHHLVDDKHCCMPTLLSDFGKIQKLHKNLRNRTLPLRLLAYTQPCWGHPRMSVSFECWVAVLTQQTTQCVKEDTLWTLRRHRGSPLWSGESVYCFLGYNCSNPSYCWVSTTTWQASEQLDGQGLRWCGKEHTSYEAHPCCAAQGGTELQGAGLVH